MFDTAGQEDYAKLSSSSLCFESSEVFHVCFSVVEPDFFFNAKQKNVPFYYEQGVSKSGTRSGIRFKIIVLSPVQDPVQNGLTRPCIPVLDSVLLFKMG